MLHDVQRPATSDPAWKRSTNERDVRDTGFGAADVVNFFRRNSVPLLASIAVPLVVMAIYLVLTKPIFRADSQILIDANLPQIFRDPVGGEYRGLLDASQIESQIAILRSEQIALAVVTKAEFFDVAPVGISTETTVGPQDVRGGADKYRRALEAFHSGLQVRRIGRSYVIEVSYSALNPERAAIIADATVEAYISDQFKSRAETARQGSQWLEGRIEDLRVQMNGAARKVQEFKARRDYRIVSKPEAGQSLDQQPPGTPPAAQITLDELESTAQTYRKIYESYLQAHTESVQRQSYPVTNARVITRATAVKSHPKVFLLLLVALLGGIAGGVAIALIRETLLPLESVHKRTN